MKNWIHRTIGSITVLAVSACIGLAGCSSGAKDEPLGENSGSTLTTSAGQKLNESMFLGKWDVDGERNNTANGDAGVGAIPSDIMKDMFGKGWRFESNGVFKTDQVIGTKAGTWRLEGNDTLMVQHGGQPDQQRFAASFRDGYLYLKRSDNKTMVFEKDKYFGH